MDPEKIILPPLHIKLGSIKHFFFKLLELYVFIRHTCTTTLQFKIFSFRLHIYFRIVKTSDPIQQNGSYFCNQHVLIIQNQLMKLKQLQKLF